MRNLTYWRAVRPTRIMLKSRFLLIVTKLEVNNGIAFLIQGLDNRMNKTLLIKMISDIWLWMKRELNDKLMSSIASKMNNVKSVLERDLILISFHESNKGRNKFNKILYGNIMGLSLQTPLTLNLERGYRSYTIKMTYLGQIK